MKKQRHITTNEEDDDLVTRVARLDERYDSLEVTVNKLVQSVDLLNTSVIHLDKKLGEVGKTDFKSILSVIGGAGGVLIAVGAGLWGLAIAPLQARVIGLETQQGTLISSVNQIENLKQRTDLELREIETQFRAKDMVRNEQLQQQERLNGFLWHHATGEEYTPRTYWPSISRE